MKPVIIEWKILNDWFADKPQPESVCVCVCVGER